MTVATGQEKIAVLLTGLGPAAAETVLGRLRAERAMAVRGVMRRLAQSPPPPELVERVVREFEEILRSSRLETAENLKVAAGTQRDETRRAGVHVTGAHAVATAPSVAPGGPTATTRGGPRAQETPYPPRGDAGHGEAGGDFAAGDDPAALLADIDPDKLAAALLGEQPRTVAMIVGCLDAQKAPELLKRLPAEVRREVFICLGRGDGRGADLLPRIVHAVIHKAHEMPSHTVQPGGDAKYKRMAELLRSLDRADRLEILAALEQQDEQTAAMVKERLYLFEDLLLIENRSMQKLLGEIDAKVLATALKTADEPITEKVLSNLSKRARDSLSEEMEFLGAVSPAKVQEAQRTVTEVIQRLDQAGELVMEGSVAE